MYFISTAKQTAPQSLSAAIKAGLAKDGGLFVPEQMPRIDLSLLSPELSYPDFACRLLERFFKGDELASSLRASCESAFHFPIPLKQIDSNTFVLELFHGPTSSFKDFGAHFLAECLAAKAEGLKTIMVATSGDTGSAVASAFYRKLNYRALILYPRGQVSAKQEQQMTCWDENVISLAVEGTFDDCQQLVKAAFRQADWQALGLSSANSINIGRLLPQLCYYAYSAMKFYSQYGAKPGFIIPSGNLGNATAAYWAKAMGFPIREIVLATNANRVLPDFLESANYEPRRSIATMANAMDVGNPSNLERLRYLFSSFDKFKQNVKAISVSDEAIRQTIKECYERYAYILCPHTATAFYVRQLVDQQPWIVAATADPSKFDELIEPLIKTKVPIAPQLQKLLDKPARVMNVEANLSAIKKILVQGCF